MKAARKVYPLNGAVLWEGASEFDGHPIVLIATSLRRRGKWYLANEKTGDVVQTWILRRDLDPYDALRDGEDVSFCGDCPLRPEGSGSTSRACYVHIGMVHNVWVAYRKGRYQDRPRENELRDILSTRKMRLGSFGDPAAVPLRVWAELCEMSAGWIGYTHAWQHCPPAYSDYVMASVDTASERDLAQRRGWRTFRTLLPTERLSHSEIACPASAEGGKRANCEKCNLCDGVQYERDPRRSVAIVAHGWPSSIDAYRRMRASLPVIQG